MSKLTRQTMKWFGSTAGGSDIGIFGSLAAASPTYSKVISTIQSLAAWGSGWVAETIATNRPALEDMNAVCYVLSYGVSYLHEMGIPEWDSGTVYYQNSYCQVDGVIYYSLQDDNMGYSPIMNPTYWTTGVKGLITFTTGMIIMWSGKMNAIPSGWVLCDGTNSTPDLRNRFVICGDNVNANATPTTTVTDGSTPTQSGDGQIPAHVHTYTRYQDKINADGDPGGRWANDSSQNTGSYGTGVKNVAVYFALAFIMKS